MNDTLGRSRGARQPWPPPRFLAAMACTALLAAACGGSPASATGGSSAYQKALPFAQCMRSHGIQNFPDPDSSGGFNVGDSVNTSTPQYAAVKSTCVRLHPYNMVLSPQQKAGLMSQALKFAHCMRAHGVPSFPDPVENNSGISFGSQADISGAPPHHDGSSPSARTGTGGTGAGQPSTSPGSGPPESPQYQAAAQACRNYEGKGNL